MSIGQIRAVMQVCRLSIIAALVIASFYVSQETLEPWLVAGIAFCVVSLAASYWLRHRGKQGSLVNGR